MAKLPEWCYEGLGTMFFTMVTMSAWAAEKNILSTAFCVGMSYALMHVVFNTHCPAYFNPVLCAAQTVKGKHNMYDTLWLIVGEYLGAACGAGLIGKITDFPVLTQATEASKSKELVILVIMAALLVKFFWSNNSDTGVPDAIWFAFAIAIVSCVGSSDSSNHMANPAVYTAQGVLDLIQAPLSFDLSFFGDQMAGNLALYAGALISVLVSAS
jgi:glycerol uptake facilitator-like aquaporin